MPQCHSRNLICRLEICQVALNVTVRIVRDPSTKRISHTYPNELYFMCREARRPCKYHSRNRLTCKNEGHYVPTYIDEYMVPDTADAGVITPYIAVKDLEETGTGVVLQGGVE